MKKRVFIVHGWGGSPKSDFLPWLHKELEVKGFEVCVPKMPNSEEPRIETWVPYLAQAVGIVDESEDEAITKQWAEAPIDLKKIKSHLSKSVAIFSDSDPYVPLNNKEIFEKELGSKTIIEHAKGHFTDGDNITQLPIALKSILEISN